MTRASYVLDLTDVVDQTYRGRHNRTIEQSFMATQSNQLELTHDVESRIIKSLKKRGGVATAGDIAADTGLGYDKAEWALQQLLELYKSHLDVDDDGNLRYRFEPKFIRRGADPGATWRAIKRGSWRAFMAFFKVWTMVMLVGYTVLFVLVLLAGGIAALASRGEDNRGGGGDLVMLPFMLVARFLEFMFWWNIMSGPNQSYRRRSRGGMFGGRRAPRKKPTKPFYQAIFDYLFGPQLKPADPLAPARAFAQFARHRRGRVSAAEWASRTGQSLDKAGNALTASLSRFDGDVDVTEDGQLIYRFDNLMVTAWEGSGREAADIRPIWERPVKMKPFTGNEGSSNTWITAFNAFNLVMAIGVLMVSNDASVQPPLDPEITIFLGWVPLVFSAIFFAIPALRRLVYNRQREKAREENERRQAMAIVFKSASEDRDAHPVGEHLIPEKYQDKFLLDYAGDITVTDLGQTVYTFPEISADFDAARQARESAEREVVFGKTVFSSDEKEKSLDEAAMEDFDRRLARELGGDVVEFELEHSVGHIA